MLLPGQGPLPQVTGTGQGVALVKQLPCGTAGGMQPSAGCLQDRCPVSLQHPALQHPQVGLKIVSAETVLAAGVRAWALRLCMSPAV